MINQNHLICCRLVRRGRYRSRDTREEGKILGDNAAGHCLALKDLFQMNFFK